MMSLSKKVNNSEKLDRERGMSHYFCRFGSSLKSHKNKAIIKVDISFLCSSKIKYLL